MGCGFAKNTKSAVANKLKESAEVKQNIKKTEKTTLIVQKDIPDKVIAIKNPASYKVFISMIEEPGENLHDPEENLNKPEEKLDSPKGNFDNLEEINNKLMNDS
jgi:hypothetical protein